MTKVLPTFFTTTTEGGKRKIEMFKAVELDGIWFVYTPDSKTVLLQREDRKSVPVDKATFINIINALGKDDFDD